MNEKHSAQLTHEEELELAIKEIRERVLARYPKGIWNGLELPDFTPVLEARDQAAAKVAAIGRVNPRAGGPINSAIQFVKNTISRGLNWFVRDQVDFNHATVRSLDAVLEGLNAINRTLKTLPARFEPPMDEIRRETSELKDIRSHWITWRREWEERVATNEIQFLRAIADLQNAYAQRTAILEQRFEERTKDQHRDFEGALERSNFAMQERFWKELEKVRVEYERIIYAELRAMRHRPQGFTSGGALPTGMAPTEAPLDLDWVHFAQKFRGGAVRIAEHFSGYAPHFAECTRVLDIGCGRGEFLEVMKKANVPAVGVDLYEANVALCREQGLEAEKADVLDRKSVV